MRTHSFFLVALFLTPFLVMCTGCNGFRAKNAQLLEALDSVTGRPIEPPSQADDGSDTFQQALQFHQFATGQLGDEARRNLIAICNAGNGSPFCYSVKRYRQWQAYVPEETLQEVAPPPIPAVPPAVSDAKPTPPVDFSTPTSKDFARWRRTDTDRLIENLAKIPLSDLAPLRKGAMERRCPNNLAIALGATYEDHFPTSVDPKIPGELYARASICERSGRPNKEHFLTRAGLLHYLAGNYTRAADLLGQVRPTDAYTGRAYYWLARSFEMLGMQEKADRTYKRLWIHHRYSFHALVAALQKDKSPSQLLFRGSSSIQTRSKKSRLTNTLLEQIEILSRYQMPTSATILAGWAWDKGRGVEPEVRLYLATLANAHFKVNRLPSLFLTTSRIVGEKALRVAFPQPYREQIQDNGFGITPELLWAIGRKESKFNPLATSHADARGLLQVHPQTAERLTGRADLDLHNPSINIPLSAFYVDRLIKRYKGDLRWVLAAYNAGELAADSWIRRFPVDDPILQIDLITFRETRTYVGFVLANYYWYRWLEGKNDGLRFLLPDTLARGPGSAESPSPTATPLNPVPLEILPTQPLLPPEP